MDEKYEEFSESEVKLLERFVTSTTSPIFALRNLPEVIKGALFSRYSRSTLGLRSLLLKEFIQNDQETGFGAIAHTLEEHQKSSEEELLAIKKAKDFYDRILDGYGDDSIGELGGAHLAIENVSMLAAKQIEDCRIGGSPLEKSTRYIYFDQKVNGDYLYYKEPVLMTSAFRTLYQETCQHLFETYSKLIPPLTKQMEERFPKEEATSKGAYQASIRAKVLDCLRGLLPSGTLTNMGVFGNGRFFEMLLHKLQTSSLTESNEIGKRAFEELSKVIPSFVRRADPKHHTHTAWAKYHAAMEQEIAAVTKKETAFSAEKSSSGVKLLESDPLGKVKVAAALLFEYSNKSLKELEEHCRLLSSERLGEILEAGAKARTTRRHKSPRALEHATFLFEIVADFGAYRDLHRHRILTQKRQLLTCDLGYFIPEEILGTPMEAPYREAMERAKKAYDQIAKELPEEAQYVVPMGYNLRWYFQINLRGLQWLTELRSSPAGHPTYRLIAQEMAKAAIASEPEFERFFRFVDFAGHDLGRLGQEEKRLHKEKSRVAAGH